MSEKKGSVTAFCAIVLPILLLMALVIADFYVVKNAKNIARNSLLSSCGSVLSEYSSYMFEEYMLYGYEMSDQKAEDMIKKTYAKSQAANGVFACDIQEIEIAKSNPLSSYEVMSAQITRIMDDEIFKVLIQKADDQIKLFSNLKSVIKVFSAKMNIDELLSGLKAIHKGMKEITDELNDARYYEDLFEMVSYLSNMCDEMKNASEDDMIYLQKQALFYIDTAIDYHVYVIKEYNKQGISYLRNLSETNGKIHALSDFIKEVTGEIKDCPKYMNVIMDMCISTVESLENSFSDVFFERLETTFETNIQCLEKGLEQLKKAVSENANASIEYEFYDAMSQYGDVLYDIWALDDFFSQVLAETEQDVRGHFMDVASNLLSSVEVSDNVIDKFIPLISSANTASFGFIPDMKKNSTKSIVTGLDDLCTRLENVKQDFYLNEYILLFFSNRTSMNTSRIKTENTGVDETYGKPYLKCESEYIIFGQRDNSKNINSCSSLLTAIRFAFNTLHVYTDVTKTTKAQAIASAIAGSLSFGAATPVAKHLILCSWAYAESAYDVSILNSGKKCALFKQDGDWVTDIGIANGVTKTPDPLKFEYEDYLRLILCTVDKQSKAQRILDIISLNAPDKKDMSGMYCKITVKAALCTKGLLGIQRHFDIEVSDEY